MKWNEREWDGIKQASGIDDHDSHCILLFRSVSGMMIDTLARLVDFFSETENLSFAMSE